MPVKPVSPDEVLQLKTETIPDVVFETFNELIVERAQRGTIVISQSEVVDKLVERGLERSEIFNRHWLDIEDAYKAAGWQVLYDKPGYNESYEATWTFSKKRD